MSVAPPVPGHLHTLDLPTSGIDDEPLAPTAVHVSRDAENEGPKTPVLRNRTSVKSSQVKYTGTLIFRLNLHRATEHRRALGPQRYGASWPRAAATSLSR